MSFVPPIHSSITGDRVVDAILRWQHGLDNPGFCLACGADAEGCEPGARRYECEICGEKQVYGASEVLLMMP